jgi:long-chain-fatty-acid--CoA ligase ACSBG
MSATDVSETYVAYSGSGPWFTCEPNGEIQPRLATRGKASEQGTLPNTSIALLQKAVERCRDKPHSKVERGLPLVKDNVAPDPLPAEDWKTWTYGQLHDEIRSIAKAFIKLGMQPFDSVNIWGFNAPEWIMASYAAQFAGGKAAGIYPTDADETASYKVVHSGGSIIVVEEKSKIAKLAKGIKARGDAKSIKAIIVYGEGQQVADGEKHLLEGCGEVPVLSWEKCKKMGEEQNDNELDNRIRNVRPGHCCALIYTSGTTGDPKAVMVSHDNLIFASSTVFGEITRAVDFSKEEQMRAISYLPLSHVAGMMVDIVGPVYVSAYMQNYETIYYARPYDLKMGTIKFRLQVARPTLFLVSHLCGKRLLTRFGPSELPIQVSRRLSVIFQRERIWSIAEVCRLASNQVIRVAAVCQRRSWAR